MTQVDNYHDGHVDVVLEGGPGDLPADLRNQRVANAVEKIKIVYCGGYEHFEWCSEQRDGRVVYRWTMRTAIAE